MPDFEVSSVRVPDVLDYVETVRKVTEAVARKTREPSQFFQIMQALVNGRATLWVIAEDGHTVGHLVSTFYEDPFTRARRLHIWAMHGHGLKRWVVPGLREAQKVAQQAGAQQVTFASVRKGWERFIKQHMPEVSARLQFSLKV